MRAAERFTDRARMRHRIGHAEMPQRHERHDVERADAPVHASVRAHVDGREDGLGQRERRRLDGAGRAHEREHRAVMVGIGVDVGQPHARDAADGVAEALDDAAIAPLADVRHALEHGAASRDDDSGCAGLP